MLGWTYCRRGKPDRGCCVLHDWVSELSDIMRAENGKSGDDAD